VEQSYVWLWSCNGQEIREGRSSGTVPELAINGGEGAASRSDT
jgi:hypothetical protein